MRRGSVVRFLVVGGGAALVELGVFQVLQLLGTAPVPANVASFLVGMVTSFVGYRAWSFAGDHQYHVAGQFAAYATLAGINVVATSLLIHAATSAGVVPLVAKAGCMVLVATWNFLLLNRIIFRHRTSEPDRDAGTGA